MKNYSNYHNANPNDKINHNGLLILEKALTGFESTDVTINDTVKSQVLIYQKWDAKSQTKKVIGRVKDIEIGNLLKFNGFNWLVTTFPEDNKLYRKAEIELCNDTFTVVVAGKKLDAGKDDFGRPIPATIEDKLYQLPCVLTTKDNVTNNIDNSPIPLPDGTMSIKVKYYPNIVPKINFEFKYRNENFKVVNIFYDNVINEKGFIEIRAKKIT